MKTNERKNKKNLLSAAALALIAAAVFTACASTSGRSENPGTFTLTGIPEEFDGHKFVKYSFYSSPLNLYTSPVQGEVNISYVPVTNGALTLPLYKQGYYSRSGYIGSDTCFIGCFLSYDGNEAELFFESVRFDSGVATVNWNQGKVEWVARAASSAPALAATTPSAPSTPAPAVPAPAPQLLPESIFVGGTPPQGTRDSYAAMLPTFNDALDWLDLYTRDGGNYIIVLGSDQAIAGARLGYGDKRVAITLTASGGGRTVKFSKVDGFNILPLFTLKANVTFTLEDGVTLSGAGIYHFRAGTGSVFRGWVVKIDGGRFIMNGGALRDLQYAGDHGGIPVAVSSEKSEFIMNGGDISGSNNTGISVDKGTFTMSGGTISRNEDHGVTMANGTFNLTGGTISRNRRNGVSVNGGTFTMSGGIISDNSSGGVSVGGKGTFNLASGTISGNTSESGGGVYVSETFTMTGGDISGNTAKNGGGVYVGGYYQGNGTFTMSGGTIGGNSAGESGGGVYTRGMFTKSDTGGIVYGSNAPVGQANKAPSDAAGHAVYVAGERPQKRTTTAGESTALDSRKSLVAGGGWE